MTRYQRLAKKAIAKHLQGKTEPILLFTLSVIADRAALQAGKKRDLYDSLYDYEWLLPANEWKPKWLTARNSTGGGFLMAVRNDWKPDDSNELIPAKLF